jgi:hypothetical protein
MLRNNLCIRDEKREHASRLNNVENKCIPKRFFATKGLPFCQKRFATSTSETCRTGKIACEKMISFLGSAMVPKSQKRQTFSTMPLWKTDPFPLNLRQTFSTIKAKVYDKLQIGAEMNRR